MRPGVHESYSEGIATSVAATAPIVRATLAAHVAQQSGGAVGSPETLQSDPWDRGDEVRADGDRPCADAVTLTRGLAILEVIASGVGANGVTQALIARRLGMSRSTLYRYLGALREAGYVDVDAVSHRYHLGVQLHILTARAGLHGVFAGLAPVYSRRASLATQEHGVAAVFSREYVVPVASAPVPHSHDRFAALPVDRRGDPVHSSAAGKVLLAWDAERLPAEYWERPLERFTERTITDPEALLDQLDQVRRQGFAVESGERHPGITCVAAPVRDGTRAVVGALAVAVATEALSPPAVASIADRLLSVASDYSTDLAWASSVQPGSGSRQGDATAAPTPWTGRLSVLGPAR